MCATVRTQITAAASTATRCIVCGSATNADVTSWTARCETCGTWSSTLEPAINERAQKVIDDDARLAGLQALRRENFRAVLDRLEAARPLHGMRLLDVGCAEGWFLEDAAERGAKTLGLEPDEARALRAQSRGLHVRMGRFPQALDRGEQFDVITFNDVLEHLPNVRDALSACHAHLASGGLLSVNIPTSDGLGYRIATVLARIGIRGPFSRFWQAGLPSPHTHYFPRSAIRRLIEDAGFVVEGVFALTAVSSTGLWQRVHVLRRPSLGSLGAYAALRVTAPILNEPSLSDIAHLVAIRR